MSQLSKSMPKMRTTFSPRVKSAHNTHALEQKNFFSFTDKNTPHKHSINPEHIQQQLSKKLSFANQSLKIGKIDFSILNTDSPTKRNSLISKTPINKINQHSRQNDKKPFRQMQWPNKEKKNHHFDSNPGQTCNQGKISRCMSAQTFRSGISSRSQKSNRIKESRKQFNDKFEVALDYLMTKNSAFLEQKLSMCNQKARPKQQIFTVMRPSINTTNKDFFKNNVDKHKLDIQPQNEKMSILLSPSKVCGNSTSQEFHKGVSQKRPDLAEWAEGFKLQGPIYEATTYSNAYPNHGEFKKMVPIAVWNEHPLGMKHKETTTNSREYKGEFRSRSQLASWKNLNPVANDLFNTKKRTAYEQFHGKKERQQIQQWPLADHKLIRTDGMFNTEMRTSMLNFNSHELHVENKCDCGRKKH